MQSVNKGVMRMLMSIAQHNRSRRSRRCLWLVAAAAAAAATLAIQAEPVVAHDGPGSTYEQCTSRFGGGDSWESFSGLIYGAPFSAEHFYARITPAAPFGWSGYLVVNGAPHPSIIVPPGTSHWFPAPVRTTGSSGTFGWSVDVRPNPGVFNNYRLDIVSPRPCS